MRFPKITRRLENLSMKFGNFAFTHEEQVLIYKMILSLKDQITDHLESMPGADAGIGKKFETDSNGVYTLLARGTYDQIMKIQELEDSNCERETLDNYYRDKWEDDSVFDKTWFAAYEHTLEEIVYYPEGKNPDED